MAKHTFTGGVHPFEGKDMSRDVPIKTLLPDTGEMVYPLLQHIGNPSVPVVRRGDYVRTGQLIARADRDPSANLHASVSGQVLGIDKRRTADGSLQPCIIIANDGIFLEIGYPQNRELSFLTRETVLTVVKNAGIVGMGGAGLPTHIKLRSAGEEDIDTIIANCVECEPYLTSDYRRLLENPWKVISGLAVLLQIYPGARGYIAVSEDNAEGYRLLRELLRDDPRIYVKRLRTKYPQGAERQLIYALTGRTLNAKMLPRDIGCLVCNTDTLVAVNQAVIMHEPLITRIVTVTGAAAAQPGNFRVRIGMSYRQVLEQAGGLADGLKQEDALILDGGPMTGVPIRDLDVPITKLSSAIVCLRKEEMQRQKETACTRCSRCLDVCPNRLMPVVLYQDARRSSARSFIDHNGLECCDCGCCSYICPSKISLAAPIIAMRHALLKKPELAGDYARRFQRE